jgi:hypothetical protein
MFGDCGKKTGWKSGNLRRHERGPQFFYLHRGLQLIALVLATLLSLVLPVRASQQDFSFINATPWEIESVFVRASGGSYPWSNDALGTSSLSSGESTSITFSNVIGCIQDIEVVWNGGQTNEWDGLNLCSISTIAVWYNSDTQSYEESSD